MGRKRQNKKSARKLVKKIERTIEKSDLTETDFVHAGVGLLAATMDGRKAKKRFKRAVKRGRRLTARGLSLSEPAPTKAESAPEPVISYEHTGGGWYEVSVAGTKVDTIQGEEAAASRAAELLAAYAALESREQHSETSIKHTGGGWYEVTVSGVPIGRYRGTEAVTGQFGHLNATPPS